MFFLYKLFYFVFLQYVHLTSPFFLTSSLLIEKIIALFYCKGLAGSSINNIAWRVVGKRSCWGYDSTEKETLVFHGANS